MRVKWHASVAIALRSLLSLYFKFKTYWFLNFCFHGTVCPNIITLLMTGFEKKWHNCHHMYEYQMLLYLCQNAM